MDQLMTSLPWLRHCLEVDKQENNVTIVCDDAGRSMDLLSRDAPLLKWNLRDFASRAILAGLQERVTPDSEGSCDRKDLVGFTTVIDKHATLALAASSQGCGVDAQTDQIRAPGHPFRISDVFRSPACGQTYPE